MSKDKLNPMFPGALLLYISADGSFPVRPMPEDTGYDLGGVLMAPRREVEPAGKGVKEHCCLFPGDLFPYTRRCFPRLFVA